MINNWLITFYKKKDFLFLVLLLGGYVFISSLPSLFGVDSRFFSVPYRFFVFTFSFFILIENRLTLKSRSKLIFLFSLFWIFYAFKVYYSFSKDFYLPEILKQENEIYIRIFVVNLIPCLALLSIDYSKINIKILTKYLFWILFVMLFINFVYTSLFLKLFDKISGIFSVYYISSGHFGASLVILCSYLLMFKTDENILNNKLLVSGIFLGLFAIFISAARSPILAIIIIGIYFIILKNKIKYVYLFFILLISFCSIIYGFKEFLQFESAFVDRNYVAVFEGNSSGRESLFSKSFPIIKNNLIVGGRVLYEDGMYPHNIFLELLMSGGILLLSVFGMLFYPLIKKLRYFFRFSNLKFYILIIFALWIQYLTLIQTSYNIHCNAEFWYFSCVVIGISLNIYNEETKSNDGSWNPSGNNTLI